MSLTTSFTATRPTLRAHAARTITRTSVSGRQVAAAAALLLSFPVAVNLTGLAASGSGPTTDQPLWQRGQSTSEVAPVRTTGDAGR